MSTEVVPVSSNGGGNQRMDAIDKKWDQCLAKLIVQSGIGAAVGVGLSVILLRRRFWPIPLSVGFAAGMSFQECRLNFGNNKN